MQPKGVQAVVRAILEGGMGGESDWRTCEAVAWILVTPPQQCASADSYFTHVCPQILDLLHLKDQLTAQQFQRVATRSLLLLVQEQPGAARTLHRCSPASSEGQSQAAVEESELSQCVSDVYKIWVNVSHLRAPCQEILLRYLGHAEPAAALTALRQLSGLQGQRRSGGAADLLFTPGSDGGARLSCRERCSEEDDALYEKLSGEQWRLEVLMQLLNELKDSDLPGDFFLELLQGLASCAAAVEEEEDEEELEVSAMTLLEVEQQVLGAAARRGHRLALLQVLAMMVECVQHTVLLRKPSQVVDFMGSLLQRACVGLDPGRGPGSGNPVESDTLSMGVGLLATLLSGPQLSAEDYSSMRRLLPPLETLSEKHPDVFIQELASNLRAVIATHGAYRPEHFPSEAQGCRGPDTMSQNTRSACRWGRTSGTSKPGPPVKPFSDLLLEACDPDVPTRAFALRVLTLMVRKQNPEAAQEREKVLMLFLENLEHEDSFVYLSAIQGLAALADSYPERILERLLKDFQHGPSLPTSITEHALETRLKVGEVLMRASRAMGDLAPHFGRPLVGVFLQGTRDPDPGVRASSLSNLGELCPRLDSALPALAQELSSCLTALIKTEKEAEVRRASVHVITLLLRGLSDKTTQVLSDVLLDLYRALKWVVRSDPDGVAVLHAQLALEELDDVMRRFIFPEQKLQKKIVVLQ
ncbi:hypothetical protein KUCAC02_011913 [Chaenocephalus aceratus]|uniref:Uncharacterized protein n=1 Tax=Chaenocephalus aceratus TaxID=36190 RepID=A0ACB9X9V1_CHAAC|nr:hypothetical protein KUCAC02_011913 [Chaenocephalus aceratus]